MIDAEANKTRSNMYFKSLLFQFCTYFKAMTVKAPISVTAPPVNNYNGNTSLPSQFEAKCHPLERKITEEVNGFFLKNWPFRSEKDKKKFVAAGFSRVTCLYFPEALDDRIHLACRLLTILFLIDGKLFIHLAPLARIIEPGI
jgi:hypothetical protein